MKHFKSVLTLICWLNVGVSFAETRPNILLIVSEDNGPELGCYGDKSARTPNLNQLADEGILFRHAYVPQAGCSQSRASFLTGLYPHQHGQFGLATWGFRLYREDIPNLPRSLKGAGYRTGIIGKLHVNPASAFPFDMHEIQSANFQRENLEDYAQHAKRFFNETDSPFFLSVNYPDAHRPWITQVDGMPRLPQTRDDVQVMPYMGIDSPAFRELAADHYNCMARLDSLIGDLLDTLQESGKAENTIVIYIGDHGADMLRGKRTCYEGGLRVPMLMRWPNHISPQVRNELVSTLDLMPTLLEASGADSISDLPGKELQPLFQEGPAAWPTHFYAEYHTHAAAPNYYPQRSVRNARYKLIQSLLPNTIHPDYDITIEKLEVSNRGYKQRGKLDLKMLIGNASKEVRAAYGLMRKPPQYQLYDLQDDPYEFKNLADNPDYADVLADLQAKLTHWRQTTNDPLLDPQKLQRLTDEVLSVKKKSDAKRFNWEYPEYLLD